MKVNQTTNICPRLKPVQLPLVGKWVSINSATRIFCRKAMMTGISSVRSWVMVMCSLIPRAYLNSYFLAKIRTNCEMYGNVWEWVHDWYGSYTAGTGVDPAGPSSGSRRVYRGGGWLNTASVCRSGFRGSVAPGFRNADL